MFATLRPHELDPYIIGCSRTANGHFIGVKPGDGTLVELGGFHHRTLLGGFGWDGTQVHQLPGDETHHGFVLEGRVLLLHKISGREHTSELFAGMYFSCPEPCELRLEHGARGAVFSRVGWRGLFSTGGPLEKKGRYRYLDGGSAGLPVPPPCLGDPCLNHLHFPARCQQASHTHPSDRCTLVFQGEGKCVVPKHADGSGGPLEIPLRPGCMFIIPQGGRHAIRTEGRAMDIVTFHPTTTLGYTDDSHPMLDATEDIEQPFTGRTKPSRVPVVCGW